MYFLVFHNLGENALRIICTTMQLSSQEPGTVSSARQELLLPFCRWDHRVTASLTRGSRMWHLSLLWVPHTVMRIHARPLPRMDRGILQDVGSGAGSLEGTRVKGPRVTAALHPQTPGKALKRETCTAQEFTGHTGEFERGQGRNFHLLILP